MERVYNEFSKITQRKLFFNIVDEMDYHGYKYKSHSIDDISNIIFSKKGEKDINVILLFGYKDNPFTVALSRKNDFETNLKRIIINDAENWLIYSTNEVYKAVEKHTKGMVDTEIILRSRSRFVRNIKNAIVKAGISRTRRDVIKHMESMYMLKNYASHSPKINLDDLISRMLRLKKGDFITLDHLDYTIKSFTTTFFLGH